MPNNQEIWKDLLLKLVSANTSLDIDRLLTVEKVLSNGMVKWIPYGDDEGNFRIISNQQKDPVNALVEKPINSVDAILLKECKKRGIDPESDKAPQNMREAIKLFFNISNGDISLLKEQERKEIVNKLAKNIKIIADGLKERPTISVIDNGEGQHPSDFHDTLLSLQKKNKIRIQFVQGKYNMGSTGVLSFCGNNGYQLILSRKSKELLNGKEDLWGFTLVRLQHGEDRQMKMPWFEYCVDKDSKVLSFPGCPLSILPDGEIFESGCYIKMFDYDLKNPSIITRDLWREMNRKLISLPLPVLIQENRVQHFKLTKGKNDTIYLLGNRVRALKEHHSHVNISYPITAELGKFGQKKIEIIVFKDQDEKGDVLHQDFTTESECIFLTVNGQTHYALSRSIIKKFYPYLDRYVMIHIDLTDSGNLVNEIFMGNREEVRRNDTYRFFEERLITEIKEDPKLRELNEQYRNRELARTQPDKGEMKKILEELVQKNPALLKLFGIGIDIKVTEPKNQEKPSIPYVGNYIPTFLKIKDYEPPKSNPLKDYIKKISINRYGIFRLETDATNDYLNRESDNGEFIFKHGDVLEIGGGSLNDGVVPLTISPNKKANLFASDYVTIELTRPKMESLIVRFMVEFEREREANKNPLGKKKPKGQGYALPNIKSIFQDNWENDWTGDDISKVNITPQNIDIIVNMDSNPLHNFINNNPDKITGDLRKQIEESYKISIALLSFALDVKLDKLEGNGNKELIFSTAMKGIGEMILPILFSKKIAIQF